MQTFKELDNLDIIVLMPFGSSLYGTEVTMDDLNDEERKDPKEYLSDRDFKGIYLPTKMDIYNNRIKKSFKFDSQKDPNAKNTSDDIDVEIYSLQHFIGMALKGDTSAMDMLNCPEDWLIRSSFSSSSHTIWRNIVRNKHKFYTKNLKTLVDYARGQAAKYGVKGSRISDAKNVMKFLEQFDKDSNNPRMKDVWDQLPEGEHIFKIPPCPNNSRSMWMYEVCNRKVQDTARVCYFRDEIVVKFLNDYGERARKAARNEGVDWKAISHAVRAGSQFKELITKGTITYPLADREFIKKVKLGRFSYFCMAVYLDCMMDELEELNKNSSFPKHPDYKFWENFVLSIVEKFSL